MIKIISFKQKNEWDKIVVSFPNHDIYYFHGYVDAFQLHGDGTPILIYYETIDLRGMYVAMMRDLSLLPWTIGKIQVSQWYDLTTPYGYGGWVFDGDTSIERMHDFYDEYKDFMREHNFVSNFVRYSPILKNAADLKHLSRIVDLGKTISMNLESKELIWNNIKSKNRNMIRKAIKNGVSIKHEKPTPALMSIFRDIYDETMRLDKAVDYYFFGDLFYQSILNNLKDNTEIFYALYEEKVIAIAIMLHCNRQMHYHLSGTVAEYRSMAPTNLLLYEAALWGAEKGFKLFHLGGGVGSGEDSLYKFKAAFNRNSDCQFSIGQEIYNLDMYNLLVRWRSKDDHKFDYSSSYFPIYRQNIEDNRDDKDQAISIKKIAIYGAGGLGRELAGAIRAINSEGEEQWQLVGFYDDGLKVGTSVSHYGIVLGGMDALNEVKEPMALAIAIGSPRPRKLIFDRITNPNIYYPNLIAPSFKILDPSTFKIGQGNIIQEGCSATCDVTVGNFNVLNGSNVLGHDVVVGDFNVLMPAVRLSGAVRVGCCNLFGVDSVVLQKIHVGDNVTLGAGSVLMTKPKDGQTYIGVPAKKFEFE